MKSKRSERIGWYLYDFANSAFYTTVITVFLGPYLTAVAKTASTDGFITILGIKAYYASYFTYIVAISVLAQVLLMPFIGALADMIERKKALLGILAYIGAIATMFMYFIADGNFLLGGFLFFIANLSFGSSIVVYNSYLNDLADPKDTDKVSSIGWGIGYIGGGILLLLNLLLYSNSSELNIDESFAVRISLASSGLWWAFFTIFPLFLLNDKKKKIVNQSVGYVKLTIKQLLATLKDIRYHKPAYTFLIAYLLYNDGVQTVIVVASQFGSEELGLGMDVLTSVILMVQFVAFFGSLIFGYIATKAGTKNAITISLFIWSACVIYSYSFLNNEFQFYILGVILGFVLGGTQSLSRSYFSRLIPEGKESEYFSFYEISDKGTSWIGPLIFGLTLQITQSYRSAILSLIVFFVAGLIILRRLK